MLIDREHTKPAAAVVDIVVVADALIAVAAAANSSKPFCWGKGLGWLQTFCMFFQS